MTLLLVGGGHSATTSENPVLPFTSASLVDDSAGSTDTLTIELDGAGGGTLSGPGLSGGTDNVYSLSGTAAQITASLRQLSFTPAAGLPTVTYLTVLGLHASSSAGTEAWDVSTQVANVDPAQAPEIVVGRAINTRNATTVQPFAGAMVTDPNPFSTDTLTITMLGAGGTLTGSGLTKAADGTYTLSGLPVAVAVSLDQLSFTPVAGQPGTTSTTTFVLHDTASVGLSAADQETTVTNSTDSAATASVAVAADPVPVSAAAAPPVTSATPPSTPATPSSSSVAAIPVPSVTEQIQIDQNVTYSAGVFTVTGTTSGVQAGTNVEISAIVNGQDRENLGQATVDGQGDFTFEDALTSGRQALFQATLQDQSGTTSADPGLALTGGLGISGNIGADETYTADGSQTKASGWFGPNGNQHETVGAAGVDLTVDSSGIWANHDQGANTFVFTPGHGSTGVSGFLLSGAQHDTIALTASDFNDSLANVLRHSADTAHGCVIMDPTNGDTVRLLGVTKAALVQHQRDITLQG